VKAARTQNFISMREDGDAKAQAHVTTQEEVNRAAGL